MEGLEPYDGKLSSTVLRGESGRKARDLPGVSEEIGSLQKNEKKVGKNH